MDETTTSEPGLAAARQVGQVMSATPVTVQDDDDLQLARQVMLWSGVRHLPVMRGDAVVGILSERDLLEAASEYGFQASRRTLVSEAMREDPPAVSPLDPVSEAAAKMVSASVDGLPVLDHGELVGVVTATDVLVETSKAARAPGTRSGLSVATVMTPDPQTTAPEISLYAAASTMSELGIRHLPVVDARGRLVGMLSDRDVRAAIGDPVLASAESPDREDGLTVGNAMSEGAVHVRLGAPVEELANVFTDERVGAIVVVDDEKRPVGIVSYVDLISSLVRSGR